MHACPSWVGANPKSPKSSPVTPPQLAVAMIKLFFSRKATAELQALLTSSSSICAAKKVFEQKLPREKNENKTIFVNMR